MDNYSACQHSTVYSRHWFKYFENVVYLCEQACPLRLRSVTIYDQVSSSESGKLISHEHKS